MKRILDGVSQSYLSGRVGGYLDTPLDIVSTVEPRDCLFLLLDIRFVEDYLVESAGLVEEGRVPGEYWFS